MKCKKIWTWLLFLMACSLAIPSEAQTTMDMCPDVRKSGRMVSPSGSPGLGAGAVANQPILYSFYASVGKASAIESDGKYFYSTTWEGAEGYAKGTFWLYDNQGKEVTRVVVPNSDGVRDLTTDGRYFYGGQYRVSWERNILKMDIKTGTLIDIIPVVMKQKLKEIRHCTYDPGLDGGNGGFWIGGWEEMAAVSMTGQELIPNISGVTKGCYGVGLDRVTDPSRPRLLMFQRTGKMVEIHGFDILTQKSTGLVQDMWSSLQAAIQNPKATAGGLATYEENGKLMILGNVQCDEDNWIFVYELATVNNNIPAMPKNLTVKNAGSNKAELRWTTPSTTKGGLPLSGLLTIVVRRNGIVVQTINNAAPGTPMMWTESGVSGTNFTYAVHAENQAGTGEPIYATGYKELKVWGNEGWYDKTWYAVNTGASDAVIKTAAQLAAFARRVNEGKNFEGRTVTLQPVSGNEISLAGAEWIPIGKSGSGFAGIFDGQGYQITGLSISDEVNYPYAGLFGKLLGTVRNVSLVGKINALVVSGMNIQAGSIAGYCSGIIEMCASRTGVKITGLGYTTNNVQAGGVAGCLDGGMLRYCYNVGDVEADGLTVEAGGIVGRLCGGASQLMYVYSAGRIQSPQQYRQGGVVGYHEAGTVKKCYYNKEKYAASGGLGKSFGIAADVPEQAEGKTTAYMKSSLITDLNYARFVWMKDITVVNEGYPLLNWQDVTVPQITTLAADAITVTGATLKATVKAGTMPLTGQGFEWKDAAAASYTRVSASLSSGSMLKSIIGLSKGKKYIFRAYATTTVEGETLYNYGEELSFVTASPLAAGIRCVKPLAEGKGDGSSWENASSDLQGMINASGVTEVWMTAGCYKPDTKDRKISFNIPIGKKVYGGFRGTESSVDERDLYANRTVLSGDIGLPNNNSDNTYHVVQMTGGLLDGVTVTGGNANASFSPGCDGGGVYMDGNSELWNCIILNNQGDVGGGVFLNSNAKIYNCLVTNNRSVQNPSRILGAGLHFEGGGYAYYCTITNNMGEGSYGGISHEGGNLMGCVVWNNYPSQISALGYGSWTQNYCAVEGEVASGTNISLKTDNRITGGPNFIDPSVNNYYFTGNSPLGGSGENAGTSGWATKDIFGIAYPSSGQLPIGAFCGDGSAIARLKAVVTVESKTYAYEKGKSKNVTVITNPADLRCDVEYRDRSGMLVGAPEAVGTYDVVAVVNETGYEGRGTGVLKIVESTPKAQKITWEQSKNELEVGMLAVKLGAVTDADGLKVSYYSENQNVVRVEQKGEDWYAFALAATGTANICAYQNGSESYLAAEIVKKNFTAVEVTNPQLPVPDVTTCQASAITGTSAVLNGLVVPGVLSVTGYGFEWKKETATDYIRLVLPVGGEQVSAPVSGLTPGAYYMCRTYGTVVRDGVAQTVYGTVVRFRALAVPTVTVTNGTTEVGIYTTWAEASQAIAASVLPGTFTMTIDGEITENGTTPEKPVVVTGGSLRFSSPKVIARSAVTYRNIEFLGDEVSFFASGNELIMGSGVVFALRSSYSVYGGKNADEGVDLCGLTIASGNWKRIVAGGSGEKATVKEAKIKISGGNVGEVDAGALVASWLTVEGTPAIGELKRIHTLHLNDHLSLEKGVEFKAPDAAECEVRIRKDKKLTVIGASAGSAKVTIVYDTDEVARLTQSDNGTVVIVDTAAAVDAFVLTNEQKQLKKNISTGEYTIEEVTAMSVMHLSTANNGRFDLQLAAFETIPAQLDNSRQPKDISVTAAGNNYPVDMGGTGAGVVKVVVSAENAAKINRIVAAGSGADALDVKYASGLKKLELRNAELKSLVLPDAKDKLNNLVLDTCGLIRLDQVADYTALTNLSIRGNKLTFSTLPEKPVGAVAADAFLYAPQDTVIAIPAGRRLDENVDLSSQQRNAGGGQTVYTWKTRTTGKTLVAETDYTEKNGVFKFGSVPDSIYCEMTHPAWAGLVLRTNCMFVSDPSKEEQHIVFDELGTVNLSATLLSLKASASSGLEVDFVSLDESVAGISGNVLSLRKAGEVRIMAVQPGNDLVNVASPVVRLLKIKPLTNDPGKTSQTITFNELENISQNKGVLALTATSSAGLEIRYMSSDESVAMVDGNRLVLHKAGTVTIVATQGGNETVNEAVPVSRQLIVEAVPALSEKGDQTIDFEEIGKISLKAAMVSLSAVSSADLPVSLISSNPDVASVFGSALLLHKAGTVTIIATQPGNAAYNAAPSLSRTVEIAEGSFPDKQNQVLVFNDLGTKKLSAGIWPLSATSSLGLAVTYRSSDAAVAEVSGNSLVLRAAGRVVIAATQPGNDTVNVAVPVFRELIVEVDTKDPVKQDQTITFDELGTKKQGMGILPLSATSSSGLEVTYQSSNAAVAEVSGNSLVLHAAGYVMIAATQPGNDTVNVAVPVFRELVVEAELTDPHKKDQTIVFNLVSQQNRSDKQIQLVATASSGLPVTFISSDTKTASVSGSTLSLLKAGKVWITAVQEGNDEWNKALVVARLLEIGEAVETPGQQDQAITFDLPASVNLGRRTIQLSATASSGLPVLYVSDDPAIASVSGSTLTLLQAGTVSVAAIQMGNDTWKAAVTEIRPLTVLADSTIEPGKKDQTITFPLPLSVNQATGSIQLTATASSGLSLTYASSNPEMATVSGSTLTLLKSGTVVITALQAGNNEWNAAESMTRRLMIETDSTKKPTKPDQTITFDLPLSVNQCVSSVPLAATATSGLPVVFLCSNPEMATVSGNALTPLKPGILVVTALQSGNAVWNAAEPITRMLMIEADTTTKATKQDQAITFDLPLSVNQSVNSISLTATTTSTLPVAYVSSNPEIATVFNNTLTLLKVGTVVITAFQKGDKDWNAAEPVTHTLIVKPNEQTVVFELSSPVNQSVGTLALSATATSGLPVVFGSSDPTTAVVSGTTLSLLKPGTVTITASQPGGGNWLEAESVARELVIEKNEQNITFELQSPVVQSAGVLEQQKQPLVFRCPSVVVTRQLLWCPTLL